MDEIARIERTLTAMRADDVESTADIAAVLLTLSESRHSILAASPQFERTVLMAVLEWADQMLMQRVMDPLRLDLELRAEVAISTSETAMRKLLG